MNLLILPLFNALLVLPVSIYINSVAICPDSCTLTKREHTHKSCECLPCSFNIISC